MDVWAGAGSSHRPYPWQAPVLLYNASTVADGGEEGTGKKGQNGTESRGINQAGFLPEMGLSQTLKKEIQSQG